jgi:hypothetical protein
VSYLNNRLEFTEIKMYGYKKVFDIKHDHKWQGYPTCSPPTVLMMHPTPLFDFKVITLMLFKQYGESC